MITLYTLSDDIYASIVAFIALASLLVCYVRKPTLMDYVVYAVLFAIFGLLANLYFVDPFAYWQFTATGIVLYTLGSILTLWLTDCFYKYRQRKRSNS